MSPALAGGNVASEPPGKPRHCFFFFLIETAVLQDGYCCDSHFPVEKTEVEKEVPARLGFSGPPAAVWCWSPALTHWAA